VAIRLGVITVFPKMGASDAYCPNAEQQQHEESRRAHAGVEVSRVCCAAQKDHAARRGEGLSPRANFFKKWL
jgi:hypothetical protein